MGLAARVRGAIRDRLNRQRDVDALYRILYDLVHDLDHSWELPRSSTKAAFGRQWTDLPEGDYLLSDPWFRENVVRIITEQELLLRPEWFASKRVLDAGCGNGRWSYGLSLLGADLTCVDANDSALAATRKAVSGLGNPQRFVRCPLEGLDAALSGETFDLVFCWGVAHHCVEFNRVLDNLVSATAPAGVLYLYLYGAETVTPEQELRVFRDRVAYNTQMSPDERERFLLRRARGDRARLHSMHDIYAPLINRRFTLAQVTDMLAARGLTECRQTIAHTEVFVRATRPGVDLSSDSLQAKQPPYWFEGRHA